jgi:hypothetical protein
MALNAVPILHHQSNKNDSILSAPKMKKAMSLNSIEREIKVHMDKFKDAQTLEFDIWNFAD